MSVKRRLSRLFGSLRLKDKAGKTLRRNPISDSQSQLLGDAESGNYPENNGDEGSIVLFTSAQVGILTQDPSAPAHPPNKSTNNLTHSAGGTVGGCSRNTNSAAGGDDKKMDHYEETQSIETSFLRREPESNPLQSPQPVAQKKKLKRRLSLKGLKKSEKRIRKVLKVGFVAMGNTMIHASLGSPQVYEFAIAGNNNEFDYTKKAADDWQEQEYKRKYVEFYSRRQQEFSRIDTCHYQW